MNSREIKKAADELQRAIEKREKLAKIVKLIRSDFGYRSGASFIRVNHEDNQIEVIRNPKYAGSYLDVDVVASIINSGFCTCFVRVIDGEAVLIVF